MRWKKFPWLAAGCILSVRAVFVQLGFYYHIRHALGTAQIALNPSLVFTMGFMLVFSVVIALFKDIPDVKGDQEAGEREGGGREKGGICENGGKEKGECVRPRARKEERRDSRARGGGEGGQSWGRRRGASFKVGLLCGDCTVQGYSGC